MRRTGAQIAQVITNHFVHQGTNLFGTVGIASGFFLDHPFDHAGSKGDTRRLDHLQVCRGQQVGFGHVVLLAAVGQQGLDRAQYGAADFTHGLQRVVAIEQQAQGGEVGRAVDYFTVTNHHHGRAATFAGQPHATDQGGALPVIGQGVFYGQLQRLHIRDP